MIKKRKLVNIKFNHHDLIPFDHQGTEDLIIIGALGRTLVRIIYVDNGSSVNIIYNYFLKYHSRDVQNYVQPATSVVVGFAGQSVWLVRRITFKFMKTKEEACRKPSKKISV